MIELDPPRRRREVQITFGITATPEAPSDNISHHLDYREHRVRRIEDVEACATERSWCLAHIGDPQEEATPGWMELIQELAGVPQLKAVVTHARPDDEFTVCDNEACCRRMYVGGQPDRACYACGERAWHGTNNTFADITTKLAEAAQVLKRAGKRLLVENTYEPPELMQRIMHELPDCGFTLDVGHTLISHASPIDMLYMFHDRVEHLHLHDNMGGDREALHDKHLPPGAGIAPWDEIATALREISYRGTATFECMPNPLWLDRWRERLGCQTGKPLAPASTSKRLATSGAATSI